MISRVLFLLFIINSLSLSGQRLVFDTGMMYGFAEKYNKGNTYINNSMGIQIGAYLYGADKQIGFGVLAGFNVVEEDFEKIHSGLDNPDQLFDRNFANTYSLFIGPAFKANVWYGERFVLSYKGSVGFNIINRNEIDEIFYPSNPIAVGYDSVYVNISPDYLSGKGYYLNSQLQLTYYFVKDRYYDVGVFVGLQGTLKKAESNSKLSKYFDNSLVPVETSFVENKSCTMFSFMLGVSLAFN